MEFVQTLLLGFAALCAGCVLAALRHARRPLVRAAQSAFGGIAALAAVDVLAGYTGFCAPCWCCRANGAQKAGPCAAGRLPGPQGVCYHKVQQGCASLCTGRRALLRQAAACPGKEEKR